MGRWCDTDMQREMGRWCDYRDGERDRERVRIVGLYNTFWSRRRVGEGGQGFKKTRGKLGGD